MRVMLDTNVLLSALLFPSKQMDRILTEVSMYHTLVLASVVIYELHEVIRRKFPAKEGVIDSLLAKMSYELVYTPHNIAPDRFLIRDKKDYPILYTAIVEGIDIFVTGDKDFMDLQIEKPEIITPSKFAEKYC